MGIRDSRAPAVRDPRCVRPRLARGLRGPVPRQHPRARSAGHVSLRTGPKWWCEHASVNRPIPDVSLAEAGARSLARSRSWLHNRAVMSFLDELKWRGLLHQTTGTEELVKHLASSGRVGYCGFDPDRGQPAHRQPHADQAAHALSARRPQADRADGRRHRADRRSVGQGQRAHAAVDASRSRPTSRVSARCSSASSTSPTGRNGGAAGQQRRLAREARLTSRCCATWASTSRSTR